MREMKIKRKGERKGRRSRRRRRRMEKFQGKGDLILLLDWRGRRGEGKR